MNDQSDLTPIAPNNPNPAPLSAPPTTRLTMNGSNSSKEKLPSESTLDPLKESSLNNLRNLREKLADAYASSFDANQTREQILASQQALNQANESFEAALKSHNNLFPDPTTIPPPTKKRKTTASASPYFDSLEVHEQKLVNGIAREMSYFANGDEGDIWFRRFTQQVKLHSLSRPAAALLLGKLLSRCDASRHWYNSHVLPSVATTTLEDMRAAFLEEFADQEWRFLRLQELMHVQFKKDDTVRTFVRRFTHAIDNIDIDLHDKDPDNAWFRNVFFMMLPLSVRRQIAPKKPTEYPSLHALIEQVIHFPGKPSDAEIRLFRCSGCNQKCPNCLKPSKVSSKSEKNKKRRRPFESDDETFYCKHHGEGSHNTDKCQKEARLKGSKTDKIRSDSAKTEPKKNLCRRGCGELWKYGHICPTKNDLSIKKLRISDDESMKSQDSPTYSATESDLDESKDFACRFMQVDTSNFSRSVATKADSLEDILGLTCQSLNSSSSSNLNLFVIGGKSEDNIQIPLMLKGCKIKAIMDTGATGSFISPALVKHLNCKVIPTKGNILLAGKGTRVSRKGATDSLSLSIKGKKLHHRFEIFDLPEGINCIIGMDLIPKLGIGFTGLPDEFPEETTTEIPPVTKFNSDGITSNSLKEIPVELKSLSLFKMASMLDSRLNKDSTFYLWLSCLSLLIIQSYSELLIFNAAITGFCNLAEAVVDINVGNNTPVNKRQYRIPHHQHLLVDTQVKKWLRKGVIRKMLNNTAWNNPLLVAPKKDISGTITGWRICIDPRPLNNMIPSINYPLPLIKDVLEALKGSVVFSRIDLSAGFNQFLVNPAHQEHTTFTWR